MAHVSKREKTVKLFGTNEENGVTSVLLVFRP
jgi:hypothetical protein